MHSQLTSAARSLALLARVHGRLEPALPGGVALQQSVAAVASLEFLPVEVAPSPGAPGGPGLGTHGRWAQSLLILCPHFFF